MKTLLITLLALLLLTTTVLAEEKEYRVEIKIIYNSLKRDVAKRVVEKAMLEHDEACKVSVNMESVEESQWLTTIGVTLLAE